ncbi:hypothetical protein ACIQ2D_07475 [Lysinibacillus sp. NPDC097287]|uniref:hypothetical protein n=1 Tax=Lysinibacillus sp. NPDC097287 TaxID=3364144 RepID=UPI00381F0904
MIKIIKIAALIIIGLIVIAIYVFEPLRIEPYTPKITNGEAVIPTTQGSYCWKGLISAQCVDKIYSSPLEMAKEHTPTVVSPLQEIKIAFKKVPLQGTFEVELLSDESNSKNIDVKNDKIIAPDEKGKYIYFVRANWKQGDGNYVFSVKVK